MGNCWCEVDYVSAEATLNHIFGKLCSYGNQFLKDNSQPTGGVCETKLINFQGSQIQEILVIR